MTKVYVLVFLLGSLTAYCQAPPKGRNQLDKDGKRDGAWILWWDKDWSPTDAKDSVAFYRKITYQAGKPSGIVQDYYISGNLQWEGHLLADQPEDVMDGEVTWYNENGKKEEGAEFARGRKVRIISYDAKGDRDQFRTLVMQAVLHYSNGEFAMAEQLLVQSLQMGKTDAGAMRPDYSGAVQNLAVLYVDLGRYEDAERLYIQALEMEKAAFGENHAEYGNTLGNLGLLYYEMGRYEEAEQLYAQALQIAKTELGENHNNYVSTLNNIALLYDALGRYERAEPLYIEVVQIRKSQLGENHPDYAISLNNLAHLYSEMGRYEEAERLYGQTLQIRKTQLGENHPDYAISLNNLAYLYFMTGRYKKAEQLYTQALDITKAEFGENHSDYGIALGNLALLYNEMGLYKEAEPLYVKALQIQKAELGENHLTYSYTLNGLANLYTQMRRYEEADVLGRQALQILKDQGGENHPNYAKSLSNLALLYVAMGRSDEAEQLLFQAAENIKSQFDKYFPSLSGSEKEKFYNTLKFELELFNSFDLLRSVENKSIACNMYDMQLFSKALLLNSHAKWKQRIRSSGDEKLIELYTTWEKKLSQIAKLYRETDLAKKNLLDTLLLQTNVLERDLSKRSELFSNLKSDKQVKWEEVKQMLQPDEAAVEIIRVKKFGIRKVVVDSSSLGRIYYPIKGLTDTIYYGALIITPTSTVPELIILSNGNELESRGLRYYRNCINSQTTDKLSYNLFWKPIGDGLSEEIKRVYFSPDGVFNSVNLNTLFNPKTEKYLLDEKDLQLVTNTKELFARTVEEGINKVANLYGYPDYQLSIEERVAFNQRKGSEYSGDYALKVQRGTDLTELPATKIEVEDIAVMLERKGWRSEVFTGNMALEETLKGSFRPRVLHIATHGYFKPDSLLSLYRNPLFQSGLMLAGAGRTLSGDKDDRIDDGILTAYEAMNLNLDDTELVVLSACETGLGEIRNGEGVYGLQRAFKVAGARSIIMSLWKVNDEATRLLITTFYKYWLQTGSTSDAFRKAQQFMKKKYSSPYYWGAFVKVGE